METDLPGSLYDALPEVLMAKYEATVELVEKTTTYGETSLWAAKGLAGAEAYRKYSWLTSAPLTNSAGNFRGMVVSSRWAAAFNMTNKAWSATGKVNVLASLASNALKSQNEIERILSSGDDWARKSSRVSAQVSSICLRTLVEPVPFGAELISTSLRGYLGLAGLAGFNRAAEWSDELKAAATKVRVITDQVTDGKNIHLFLDTYF